MSSAPPNSNSDFPTISNSSKLKKNAIERSLAPSPERASIPAPTPISQVPSTRIPLHLSTTEYPLTNDLPLHLLPRKYRRSFDKRVFVNRNLRLDKVQFVGFDMDCKFLPLILLDTLAKYKDIPYETLTYNLAIQELIQRGYPDSILELKYDPTFGIRGVIIDKNKGNLIKIDQYGRIVRCVHGKKKLNSQEIRDEYPDLNINIMSEGFRSQFWVCDTLFQIPSVCLLSDLVHHFESTLSLEHDSHGVSSSTFKLEYSNLFRDVITCVDSIHHNDTLKVETSQNLDEYVHRDPEQLAQLLIKLRKAGKVVFLLTNSWFHYTNKLMTWLLNTSNTDSPNSPFETENHINSNPAFTDWKDFFDIIIVAAKKPSFFSTGSTFREVNIDTGHLSIHHIHSFESNKVYHGGNYDIFCRLAGITPSTGVLYIGDSIFSDVKSSKALRGWRTMLVVPELNREITVRSTLGAKADYKHLVNLEWTKAELFRGLNSDSSEPPPAIANIRGAILQVVDKLDRRHNEYFGSPFRSGSRQSYFSYEVQRFSDLYCGDFLNFLNYPLYYNFTSEILPLAHEAGLGWLVEITEPISRYPSDNDQTPPIETEKVISLSDPSTMCIDEEDAETSHNLESSSSHSIRGRRSRTPPSRISSLRNTPELFQSKSVKSSRGVKKPVIEEEEDSSGSFFGQSGPRIKRIRK